ncbi:MAG: hypothetical protein ACM37W_18605 [Actinomycetota bacterium]
MLWAKKQISTSVTFTEDAADQTLLAAIEKELAGQQYQTFSNLCKQALWQFLSVSESAGPSPSFLRLEQRILELQQKLAELETQRSATEQNRLEGLEHHLSELKEQMALLHTTVNLKLAQAIKVVEPEAVTPKAVESAIEEPEVVELEAETSTPKELDPVLSRLSGLLEDF